MVKQRIKIISNVHFWITVAVFIAGILLHYPEQLLSTDSSSIFSFAGLSRHSIERILFLYPVGYAGFFIGTRAGIVSLVAASAIMFPRIFLISEYLPDALIETIGVIFAGAVLNLWFRNYRREKGRREQALASLEATNQQLNSLINITKHNVERLATLYDISALVGQTLELNDILTTASEKVKQVMNCDIILLFLLDERKKSIKLITYHGISDESATTLGKIKVSEGYSDIIRNGEPWLVDGDFPDVNLTGQVMRSERVKAAIIVPLKAKGNVTGVIIGAVRQARHFLTEEAELLMTIGSQIGMAIENARLYQREHIAIEQTVASEKRYREIFESAHDAIWIHDLEGNLTGANKAAEELTGYSAQELLGMNVKQFLKKDSLSLAGQIGNKLLLEEAIEQPYEQYIIRRDGSEAILKLSTSLIRENGKPKGFQHIARDVTREKEMQDKLAAAYQELSESHQRLQESQEHLIQAEKLTSLGQLAASIAHEVNNPLSGVLTYTQLLEKKMVNEGVSKKTALEYLSRMETELIRSTKLVQNLLNFARQSVPALKQVNMNEVINRALDLTSHSARMNRVQVIKQLKPDLPEIIADPDQLHQVCTNLILNAIQAMTQGGTLTITTSSTDEQIKVGVHDTGCGISPENMRKIFTPFFTTKREVKGVGLGLAISYGIIQRHHGEIEVQSKLGEGTTFTFYLPLHHTKTREKE